MKEVDHDVHQGPAVYISQRSCMHNGINLDINKDVIVEPDGYSDIIQRVVNAVDRDAHEGPPWLPHDAKVRTALILVRWLCESHAEEKSVLNDCILSKLLLGDGARAHVDGIYITIAGVWRRQQKFTLKHVRDMSDIMFQ